MGEHWHPGVGADESRPEGEVPGPGAACQDGGCIELKRLLGTHCPPELLSCQLCLLSRKNLDDYDCAWMAANKRHIQTMAVIGQKLQNGVSKPLESVLQETAALLEDEV